jgi:large subunit ribosomal protein L1
VKVGKRYRKLVESKVALKAPSLETALSFVKEHATAKFDETIEAALRLGVDPKYADQMVRGTVVLPNGTGKTLRVIVITKGEKQKEAQEAGADSVGAEDIVEKIREGWTDFDRVIATPDMMGEVSKLGKILGPRGLMPNAKVGTVTFEVGNAVREAKAGKIEFRVDKAGNLQAPIGKASFGLEALQANAQAFFAEVVRLKPSAAKGQYVRSATLTSTMGVGIRLDPNEIAGPAK